MTVAAVEQPSATVSRQIAGSTVALMLRRLILMAISSVSTVLIARILSPSHYGALQAALATWVLILAICDFGFTIVLSRDMAAHPADRGKLLRAAYEIQGAWSVGLTLVMTGLALNSGVSTERGQLLLVLAPSVLFAGVASGRVFFTVTYDVTRAVKIDLICNVVQVVAMIAVAISGFGAVSVAICVSTGTVANSLWIGLAASRSVPRQPRTRADRVLLIKRVLPLGIMGVMSKVYLSIDLVLLGFYVTGSDLGQYAAAVKLITLLNTFPGLLVSAAMPGVTTSADSPAEFRELIAKLLHWLSAAALPLFLFTAVYSRLILGTVLGRAFRPAAELLAILCMAGVVGLLSQVLGTILVSRGVVRPLLWQNLLAVCFNVGLNLVLIPIYGSLACAWLTLATETIVCAGSWLTIRRELKMHLPLKMSERSLFAAFGSTAIALALPVGALTGAAIFGMTAAVFIVAMGCWPRDLVPATAQKNGLLVFATRGSPRGGRHRASRQIPRTDWHGTKGEWHRT